MVYAFFGALLSGGLAVAILLWRKSVVENELTATRYLYGQLKDQYANLVKANQENQEIYTQELERRDSQIVTIRKQRDEALDQLVKSGTPGSIGKLLQNKH